jgi:anaerobic selenocysteine-containing dehydrogenase
MEDEKEIDPFEDCEVIDRGNTAHDHFYVEDPIQDPNSDMTSVFCTGCAHGCNITEEFKLKDGKIIKV